VGRAGFGNHATSQAGDPARAMLAAPAPEQFWRLAPPPAGWERLADE
jgi:hypothetical protein